jgi:solute:Na+ symporter, SSS family
LGAPSLLAGWAVGLFGGSVLAWEDGLKPVHTLHLGTLHFAMYVGLLALIINVVMAVVVNLALPARQQVGARLAVSGSGER